MATQTPRQISRYLQHLPGIFQQGDDPSSDFFNQLLLAYEKVLTGFGEVDDPGLEEMLDGIPDAGESQWILSGIHRYFDPGPDVPDNQRAPTEFLEWLAGWVALMVREDWTSQEKRRFISRIVPLYRKRGTKAGLVDMLLTYTGGLEVSVTEFLHPFQVGSTSTVGIDSVVGEGPPHYFMIRLTFNRLNDSDINPQEQSVVLDIPRRERIARAIVDREKPAHTYYDLFVTVASTIQVGVGSRSTVGVNTILGDIPTSGS